MATRKYQVFKKVVSYDGGITWADVNPGETVKLPVYNETCDGGYSAKRLNEEGYLTIPPMDRITKQWANILRRFYWNRETSTYMDFGAPVIIGKEVEEIGASAFTEMRHYDKETELGTGVIFETPSKVKKINSKAFLDNVNWDYLDIPDSVERIESRAFAASGFSRAMYVTIGTGCTYIGDAAFADVGYSFQGETSKIIRFRGSTPPELGTNALGYGFVGQPFVAIVPDNSLAQYRSAWSGMSGNVISDTSLGNSLKAETDSFYTVWDGGYGTQYSSICQLQNDGSTTLEISDFDECIGEQTISGEKGIVMSWLKIGDSVKTIPDNAFNGSCGNTKYIDFGNSVETIGVSAFGANGSGLLTINLPDSVKTIGNGAFYGHDKVRSIRIGTGCTYIGDNAFGGTSRNRVFHTLTLPDGIEYLGGGNFINQTVDFDFQFPSALKHLGSFGIAPKSWNVQFIRQIKLPSIESLGNDILPSFFASYFELGNDVESIGSGQCESTVVAIGAGEPPTVMNPASIDNIGKIGWMKTSLIYVQDYAIDTYKSTYGWCFLRQHIFPLSEIGNVLNFAENHKFCGLYDVEGSYIYFHPIAGQREQGLFKYGEYNGSTTLTSGETSYYSDSGKPPKILWVGDNVEYVDSNVGQGTGIVGAPNIVIFGTGLKKFKFLNSSPSGHDGIVYVFKTSTPPLWDCEVGITMGERFFVMYVPDNAVETYKEWLRDNGAIQKMNKGGYEVVLDDYLVCPLSDFYNVSDSLKKRWIEIPGQYECSGTTKMAKEKEQTTTDFINWTDTGRTRMGKRVIERLSDDCGYVSYTGKLRAITNDGTTFEVPCNGSSALTDNDLNVITAEIETAEIGDCVTSIETDQFDNSVKLVRMSNNVTSIGNDAFRYSSGMTVCKLSSGLTSIGNEAFEHCHALKELELPNGLTSIGNYAFDLCTSLSSITIPNSVTNIGNAAFSTCSSLARLNSNTDGVFNIPSGITVISSNTFAGCVSMISVNIPDNITSIGDYVFSGCDNLISVNIPDSIASIGEGAFNNCGRLTSITIPDSVERINSLTFKSCGLTSCIIGTGCTYIGEDAFADCMNLVNLTINAISPPGLRNVLVFDNTSPDLVIYVPAESVNTYKTEWIWSSFADRIQAIPGS